MTHLRLSLTAGSDGATGASGAAGVIGSATGISGTGAGSTDAAGTGATENVAVAMSAAVDAGAALPSDAAGAAVTVTDNVVANTRAGSACAPGATGTLTTISAVVREKMLTLTSSRAQQAKPTRQTRLKQASACLHPRTTWQRISTRLQPMSSVD